MTRFSLLPLLALSSAASVTLPTTLLPAQVTTITVADDDPGKAISPDLMGIFFEDLSWAADGGLYAELVQNRSFEYQAIEQPTWNNLTSWELVTRGEGRGSVVVDASFPLHPNNPHFVVLTTLQPGDGVGLKNPGFDGIPVQAGERYDLSFFARQLFIGGRWTGAGKAGSLAVTARLESADGSVLAEASFGVAERNWQEYSAVLTAARTDPAASLVLLMYAEGGIALDVVSLFPQKTFRNHANGLRADLAQVIADLRPRFMRFPGGCLVHGDGLGNMYRWKDTIGPIEQRREQANLWRYHQTVGLGYFEYFQFCEDIGAQPLPVVPAGVCCQNSGRGVGQAGLPLEQMPAYIQDVLDLIEWANGPATSAWGAKRAAAGHPEPFGLRYLGVGNEDQITPVFHERFRMIYEAVKARHPEITIVGTVGPFPDGEDYEAGWKIANELHVPMVDEHYYKPPSWFWENLRRYDAYDRAHSRVYAGEYAAHDDRRRNTLRSALAEAAHLTSLERNGDVVTMASYAPMLARRGHANWNPNLIYFSGTEVFPTINYQVQRLFSLNAGDRYLPTTVRDSAPESRFAASAVRDRASGDFILKIVNGDASPRPLCIELAGTSTLPSNATLTVLAADDADITNEADNPAPVLPQTSSIAIGRDFEMRVAPHSLTILRIAPAASSSTR